jgi:phosphate transport system substrate-binding protein
MLVKEGTNQGRIMKLKKTIRLASVLFLLVSVFTLAVACGGDDDDSASTGATGAATTPTAAASTGTTGATGATGASADVPECAPNGANALTGAGATFPFPLYSQWIDTYGKDCNVEINYQSIGSGGGIKNITEQTVDFGASDGIMNDDQIAAAEAAGGPILHIAMTSGSEAVVFNLPGIKSGGLKLDGPTLANIYLGKVKKWNDPAIAALNSGVDLPDTDIAVVHRSDGSGTTFIFTNYLSKVSDDWKNGPGYATSVEWPTGVGAQGNEGVAGQVSQIPGAIGYVELAYAIQNDIPWVQLKNEAGKFLEPSIDGTTAAAAGITIPADMKILITNQSGADAYPIAGFTWVLAYVNQKDAAKGSTLAHYLWWAIHDGQSFAKGLDYGPLSDDAVKAAEAQIMKLDCGGSPCLSQ